MKKVLARLESEDVDFVVYSDAPDQIVAETLDYHGSQGSNSFVIQDFIDLLADAGRALREGGEG